MSNLVPQDPTLQAFLAEQASIQNSGARSFASPLKIDFNGQIGKYTKRYFDEAKGESVKEDFAQEWTGTILSPVFHYYQWKYDPKKSREMRRTREFVDFNEPLEVIHINYDEQDKSKRTQSLGHYASADALKQKYGIVDPDSGDVKYPWRLVESLYIYVHELDQVVNYQFDSATTRDAFWDYKKPSGYRSINGAIVEDVTSFAQVKTTFGSSDSITHPTLKNDDGTPKVYYSGTFKSSSTNAIEELKRIMEVTQELRAWMMSFREERKVLTDLDVAKASALEAPKSDEIDLSQIPF